ncbi:MAG: amidophosphoribosyltransferase [Verrucomicrobiales bacterium]|jgi:amidophosphoribosyltransferase
MSDQLTHECGIALVRLRKPIQHYIRKHGTALWGVNKLFLLMEKQHNRGQDGVGIGCAKLKMENGFPYMFRDRSAESNSLGEVFRRHLDRFNQMVDDGTIDPEDGDSVKHHFDFGGELLMGHLRYGTSGAFDEGSCHPYIRRSNWPTKTMMVLGNFNMTNASELNQTMIDRGQHPIFSTDTQTVLEEIGYHLDEQHTDIYRSMRDAGVLGRDIPDIISERLDLHSIIHEAANNWDGGFAIAGMVGNGDSFVMRDPHGIRPCFYLETDEVFAFASERVPLMTVFNADAEDVKELPPGNAASIKADGALTIRPFTAAVEEKQCSFERIYFSRGNDPSIYQERKKMGAALVPQILDAIDNNLTNTVFSFIPNTAEIGYYGMIAGLQRHRRAEVRDAILEANREGTLTEELVDELIMGNWPRSEKIAHKDIKLRTFISQETQRANLVSHVYDISYGVVEENDNLVAIDDSIVRGTTLRTSILGMLARTNPRKIVIASTAPQIRYPDCYGIDMSEIGKFIAFQAAIELLKEGGMDSIIDSVYEECLATLSTDKPILTNAVKRIYEPFTEREISAKISEFIYPQVKEWSGKVEVIFLSVEQLREAIPDHVGDWYFTGNYPTQGGYNVCHQAFVHYYEKKGGRAYDMPLFRRETSEAEPGQGSAPRVAVTG